jgi:RNA-directed DNA polymerase
MDPGTTLALCWIRPRRRTRGEGYLNYHAVPGNLKRLGMFRAEVCRAWLRALRRRSQRTRMTRDRFRRLVAHYVPKVRARHPHPNQRFAS